LSRRKTRVKVLPAILTAVAVFVGVLALSVGLQLITSPDFHGFKKDPVPTPEVTFVTGSDSSGGKDGPAVFNWKDHHVFVIGDSLTKGATKEIEKAIDNVTVDALEGRTMAGGVKILQDWKDTGVVTRDGIIVICLGNNISGSTLSDVQTIVDMIETGQSLIMMTGNGLSNMAPSNELIRTLPNIYPFVTVADWELTIKQSPNLLSNDGVHIARNQGNVLYAELIVRALEVSQPKP